MVSGDAPPPSAGGTGQLESLLSLRHNQPAGPKTGQSRGEGPAPHSAQSPLPGPPQEGAAVGLCFSPLCRKLRSGLWAFTFLAFFEGHGFFRFL